MNREHVYGRGARWYDALSGEFVYRAGRVAGIELLGLREGDAVLDLGCGTGLNLPELVKRVGATGRIVGLDRSADMLAVAERRAERHGWANVTLVHADATDFGPRDLADGPVDAVLATYALSVFPDADAAWRNARSALRPGGRACIVDMQPPTGAARFLSPVAHLAAAAGGSDLEARPWRMLERDGSRLVRRTLRGGHIVTVAGIVG
ncbi:methyltransferase domain-containing protein [Agrococcus sp. ProA11]|uniref:class I SAM-dependent methyltransferase n=1 Tax=Agrococcus chionoecetis TaxID=3153752 RepID=UPI003260A010